jgi:hypothetical protein
MTLKILLIIIATSVTTTHAGAVSFDYENEKLRGFFISNEQCASCEDVYSMLDYASHCQCARPLHSTLYSIVAVPRGEELTLDGCCVGQFQYDLSNDGWSSFQLFEVRGRR